MPTIPRPDPCGAQRRARPGSTATAPAMLVLALALVTSACTGTSGSQVQVRAEESPSASSTTAPPPDCAEQLPPAAQAGQLLMVMVTSPELAADAVAAGTVGGFGLKGRQSADVGEQVADAVADAPVTPFVASDEEGGNAQRLALAIDELPSAAKLADGTPSEAGQLLGDYAAEMADLGFNMNFGPVVDVGSGGGLETRTFGDDVSTVASFTDVIIAAQERAGIASIVKHWPGIGGAGTDPDVALAAGESIEDLRAEDLVAFDRAFAAGASGVMVSHVVVPGLTGDDEPASLSRAAITDELRGRQRFDGLVITNPLGMGAILETVDQDEAAELAVLAGADIALVSGVDAASAAHTRLTEAITEGRVPAAQVVDSVRRVLTAKGIQGDCVDLVAAYSSSLQSATTDTDSTDSETTGSQTDSTGSSSTGTGSSSTGTGTARSSNGSTPTTSSPTGSTSTGGTSTGSSTPAGSATGSGD